MMIEYSRQPLNILKSGNVEILSFLADSGNLDSKTVESFGDEWSKFNQFSTSDIAQGAAEYFDLLDLNSSGEYRVLDAGCGSGRWSAFLAKHVNSIEAIDPSRAVLTAAIQWQQHSNIRFTQASIDDLPFPHSSFDLVVCLGVLHHMPDTADALKSLSKSLKANGSLLLYLYYNLEERSIWYRSLFMIVDVIRKIISKLSPSVKSVVCEFIALFVYWPMARFARFIKVFSPSIAAKIPLAYYSEKSFYIMRNDALDRFGTPLEKRFSKSEITSMLKNAGFSEPVFSHNAPYWHCIAKKQSA